MEIERKFLIKQLPDHLESYPHTEITQAYISTDPVIRIRQMNDDLILTVKGPGLLKREETELVLTKESFQHLKKKTDGAVIEKTRYRIPWNSLTIELDIFHGVYDGLIMAEIEYPDENTALNSDVPSWFAVEVTTDPDFQNSTLSKNEAGDIADFWDKLRNLGMLL